MISVAEQFVYKKRVRQSGPRTTRDEPRTPEGRARKKLKLGLVYGMGCVLTLAEMQIVIAQIPKGWLTKECK